MRAQAATVALLVSLVGFFVGLLLHVGAVHGSNPSSWNSVGLVALAAAFILGGRRQ